MSLLLTSEQIPSALHDHLPSDLQGGYVAHYLLIAPRCMRYLHNRYRPELSILGRCRVQLEKVGEQWQPSQQWSTASEHLHFYELPHWFAEHAAEDEHHYHNLSRKDGVHLIKHIGNLDPDTFAVDVTEVYSPVRMANPALCKRQGLVPGSSLDLRTGWNFGLRNHRENAIRLVDPEDPELLVLSPMCDQFFQINRINEARRDPQRMQAAWDTAIMHFRFAVKLCSLRHQRGKKFLLEQPWLAESWRERERERERERLRQAPAGAQRPLGSRPAVRLRPPGLPGWPPLAERDGLAHELQRDRGRPGQTLHVSPWRTRDAGERSGEEGSDLSRASLRSRLEGAEEIP